jgi:ABC-type branched-subunit amino acid transport system substrate-binding protein
MRFHPRRRPVAVPAQALRRAARCRSALGLAAALALWAALWAALVAPAGAQSLLSDGIIAAAAAPGAPPPADRLGGMDLDQLLAAARQAPMPPGLYGHLKARFEDARKSETGKDALAKLERRTIPALLRSGEGAAPAAEQERWARAFIDQFPDDERFAPVFFQLTLALYRQGKPLEESFFFDAPALASLPDAVRSRYLAIQADSAQRQGDAVKAAEFLLQDWQTAADRKEERQRAALEALDFVSDPAALQALLDRYRNVSWLQEARPFMQARALINGGRLGEALLALEQLERDHRSPNSAQQKFLLQARAEVNARLRVQPDRIGVLLPLGSSSAALRDLAQEALDGLRMAVQFSNPAGTVAARPAEEGLAFDPAPRMERAVAKRPAPNLPFQLVIRDSANNPKQAAEMVETLVKDDHVMAIIGPLARTESEAAAVRAEQLGVPLISLSLTLDLPANGQFTFRNSRSQEDEVHDLVLYAMDYLNNRRFAILYPDTAYGQRMMELFWSEAVQRGGEVVAAGAFTPFGAKPEGTRKPVGLKDLFDNFTGLDRPIGEDYRQLLEKVGDNRPDPIVDFDALYIPVGQDGAQDLRLIAPYPVTVDAEHVQLLGNRFWNDDSVLVVGGNRLDGAVFTDVFDRSSVNPRVAEFHSRHRGMFGHRVRYQAATYYTALGYDTVEMLMTLLKNPALRSHVALARALKSRAAFSGVTGLTSFRPTGEAQKESVFVRIRGGEFTRIVQ